MSADDICDYCLDPLPSRFVMRPVGFTDLDGQGRYPLVKTWCGECEPDDEIDDEANAAVTVAFARQIEEGK